MIRLTFALPFLLPSIVVAGCELDQLPRPEPSLQEKVLYSELPESMAQMPPSPLWAKGKEIIRTAMRMKDLNPTPEQLSQCKKNIVEAEKLFRSNEEDSFFDARWPIVLLIAVEHGMYEFARDAWIAKYIEVRIEKDYWPDAYDTRTKIAYGSEFRLTVDLYREEGFKKHLIKMIRYLDAYNA